MTKGRAVLIQKDKSEGNEASNCHPITCLHLTWKLLTGIFADEIYGILDNERILPEEQKGRRRNSKGTGDQLYIDKMFLQEVKRRKKKLCMLGCRELKYDWHSKNCGEFFEKNDEVLEGGVNLWC